MKKSLFKKLISFTLCLILLIFVPVKSIALSLNDSSDSFDMKVSEEVAFYLARLFINDTVQSKSSVWTTDISIINAVPMYNSLANDIVAYTFELEQGYVTVSAYIDVPNVILEWSDESTPIYTTFQNRSKGKILYTGGLNYFLDTGKAVETITGQKVDRYSLTDQLNACRSADNVQPELMKKLDRLKRGNTLSTYANGGSNEVITDALVYAQNVYGGSWKLNDWANKWEDYKNSMVASDVSPEYTEACGPIAITNAIKMYGNKYGNSTIKNSSSIAVFNNIKDIKMNWFFTYYENGVGTNAMSAGSYAKDAFKKYNVTPSISSELKSLSFQNVISACTAGNKLMLVSLLYNNNIAESVYGRHIAVGYAYSRFRATDGRTLAKTFLKICDGISTGNRYLDVSTLSVSGYYEITF